MTGTSPADEPAPDETTPGETRPEESRPEESDTEASASLLDGTVDVAAAHRAALIVAGAARDAEEARMFLSMLGLDGLPRP